MMSLNLDKKSFEDAVRKLERLPKRVRNNAARAATNAGARVIAKEIKLLAPACLKPSVKTVRRRMENGAVKVSIVSGFGRRYEKDDLLKNSVAKEGLNSASSRKAIKFFQSLQCKPAFWVEFGTYKNRNLSAHPYTVPTLKRHPDYAQYGHTMAPGKTGFFWNSSPAQRAKIGIEFIPPTPFMRPGLIRALMGGKVDEAIGKKLNEYFEKEGVK